jgi:hypothetical protein
MSHITAFTTLTSHAITSPLQKGRQSPDEDCGSKAVAETNAFFQDKAARKPLRWLQGFANMHLSSDDD